jgi:hypothetical protein
MSDRLLKALGAVDEHEALRFIAEANEYMSKVKAVTGCETYEETLAVMTPAVAMSRELTAMTGKAESAEQLGTVLAWKSSHEELPKQQAKVTELEEAGRKRDISNLIAEGLKPNAPENKHGGKLTPASAKFWENEPAAKLEAFLAVAPRVIPGEVKQASMEAKTNDNGAAADADGHAYEDIKPAKRAEMQKEDPELYNALRNDWVRRGQPAAGAKKKPNAA